MAQLQNKMYNCKKKYNCETHLLQLYYIFWHYLKLLLLTFPFLTYFQAPTPPSNGRQDEVATSRAAAGHCLSRATSFFTSDIFPCLPKGLHHHANPVRAEEVVVKHNMHAVNSFTPIRVWVGTKNFRPVGFPW